MNLTPLIRPYFCRRAARTQTWGKYTDSLQLQILQTLLKRARLTEIGRRYRFDKILQSEDIQKVFTETVPCIDYENIRNDVMRMIRGEKNVLWPGRCRWYAQSSGTSGGKSKFIPITDDSLRLNHYPGAQDSVSHYLAANPTSRMFAGKGMILGGSFANELQNLPTGVHVGDLSATLIKRVPAIVNTVRIPSKKVALLSEWDEKLPALAQAALNANVTNISGVPSWFLGVIKRILEIANAETLYEVWPNLEVFFHGGISFAPYREVYQQLTAGCPINFIETYNASEGFFASQNQLDDHSMLLIVDGGIFYEFQDIFLPDSAPIGISELQKGHTYELIITAPNGLWRYKLGDTVRIENTNPVKITIAGRTRSFINAFGEELMEYNADEAIADICRVTKASIKNYSAAPVYASNRRKGRHEWIIEWEIPPTDLENFADRLDHRLCEINSDYQAKRKDSLFLDRLTIISAKPGLFEKWLSLSGNHKLGGQRKVPRLCNDRIIADTLLSLNA